MRPLAVHGLALLVTLVANAAGLGALLLLNRPAPPPGAPPVSAADALTLQSLPPPRSQPRVPAASTSGATAPMTPLPAAPSPPSVLPGLAIGPKALPAQGLIAPLLRQGLATQASDLVMTEEAVDEAPAVLRRTAPQYPWQAAEDGTEGSVVLRLLVDRSGRVEQVEVERAAPAGVFEQAAVRAVRSWSFSPGRFQGQPVAVWCRTQVVFRLTAEDSP